MAVQGRRSVFCIGGGGGGGGLTSKQASAGDANLYGGVLEEFSARELLSLEARKCYFQHS